MNLQKIKDHFPEYSDMKLGEFFNYMHKKYYSDMKITDMYKALLKLTKIVKKEEVEEKPKEKEVAVKAEPEPKKDDTAIIELKEKIEMLTQKIEEITTKPKEEEPEKKEKDLSKITVKTKGIYKDKIINIEATAKEALSDIDKAIEDAHDMLDCIEDMESLKDVCDKHDIPKEYRDKIIKHSKQLQKQDKTELEADKQAVKQLLKIYRKEKADIEKQIEDAE